MAENAHCCFTSRSVSNPGGVGEGESRGATTPSPDPWMSQRSGLLHNIRSGVSSSPLHVPPSQLPAALSDVVYGATRFRQREQTQNKGSSNPISPAALFTDSTVHRRDDVGGIWTLSVSSRPPSRAWTVIALFDPVPGSQA